MSGERMYISLMKPLLADLLPPILLKKLRGIGLFSADKRNLIEGYQNDRLLELILFKNLQQRSNVNRINLDAQSFKTIASIGLGLRNKSNFSVLDFGGGGGHHQFTAKKIFKDVQFDWTIIETERLAQMAGSLIQDEGLTFASDLNSLESTKFYDLIFSNSALQYTEEPLDTLEKLLNLNFENLFITRIPLTNSNPFTYYQESLLSNNGPGVAGRDVEESTVIYKNHIANKESVESLLDENLSEWILVDEGAWDPLRFGEAVRTYSYVGSVNKTD